MHSKNVALYLIEILIKIVNLKKEERKKKPNRINNFPDIKLKLFENSITIYL
jgi:hypothetical protein